MFFKKKKNLSEERIIRNRDVEKTERKNDKGIFEGTCMCCLIAPIYCVISPFVLLTCFVCAPFLCVLGCLCPFKRKVDKEKLQIIPYIEHSRNSNDWDFIPEIEFQTPGSPVDEEEWLKDLTGSIDFNINIENN